METLPFAPLFIGEEKNLITPRGFSMKKNHPPLWPLAAIVKGQGCHLFSAMSPCLRRNFALLEVCHLNHWWNTCCPRCREADWYHYLCHGDAAMISCPGSLIPASHKVTVTRKLQKTMEKFLLTWFKNKKNVWNYTQSKKIYQQGHPTWGSMTVLLLRESIPKVGLRPLSVRSRGP